MKKDSPFRTVILVVALIIFVVGLSIVSNRIWGGKPEKPQESGELIIEDDMTVFQFGQSINFSG